MNKWIWAVVAIVLIFGGVMVLGNRQTGAPVGESLQETGATKTFDVVGHPEDNKPAFSVKEIRVKEGDRVRINFTNDSSFLHDFTLTEFNIKTRQLQQNESETVEFVVDKKGTFEYFCEVNNHRQLGMVGELVVE